MSLLQSAAFLRGYRFLPHRLLNRSFALLTRARRPRFAVALAIRAWVRRDAIDLADFEAGPFATVEEFFLRRLRSGARPIGDGLVAPCDGRVVAAGTLRGAGDTWLEVKGHRLALDHLVNGRRRGARPALPLERYRGGRYVSLFLSPRGYHCVHMPTDGKLLDCRWIPGRYFPQNEAALSAIDGVYERNERLVLRVQRSDGRELLLVMVGASMIGGIHLAGVPRSRFVTPSVTPLGLDRARGDELGHFTFGSTVVLILPPDLAGDATSREGDDRLMGEPLFRAR